MSLKILADNNFSNHKRIFQLFTHKTYLGYIPLFHTSTQSKLNTPPRVDGFSTPTTWPTPSIMTTGNCCFVFKWCTTHTSSPAMDNNQPSFQCCQSAGKPRQWETFTTSVNYYVIGFEGSSLWIHESTNQFMYHTN